MSVISATEEEQQEAEPCSTDSPDPRGLYRPGDPRLHSGQHKLKGRLADTQADIATGL